MGFAIPACAWSRPIGLGYEPAPRPRVPTPMTDDGPWAGVPIGGIGAGSIGRTQRGDFARWHLTVGEHRFASEPFDGFALWTAEGGAQVLRTTRPPDGWGEPLPVGAGTYRALFPRAWFEYEVPGSPIRLAEEQLTPVIPGDDAATSLPVGLFEYELENPTDRPIDAAVLLTWRDPIGAVSVEREGTSVVFRSSEPPGSFALAASGVGDVEVTLAVVRSSESGALWADFAADGRLGARPTPPDADLGAIAVRLSLAPGDTRRIRFAVSWDQPIVEFGSGRRWRKRYAREWGVSGDRAAGIAAAALGCGDEWRAAIERWQAPILDAPDRPDWYKAALFNELYLLVDGGTLWHDGPVDEGGVADVAGLALLECVDYPFYDTLDVHFYAAFALSAWWPRLEASISRAYARTVAVEDLELVEIESSGKQEPRKVAGALPHDLGGPREDPLARVNHYRFQAVNAWKDLNPKFVLQAWRDREFADDPAAYLAEVWPAVVAAMDHVSAFDRDGDGLPEHDGVPDQTYDTWPMHGPSAYGGSLWLGALRAAAAMARTVGDEGRAEEWDARFSLAQASFLARLWNGRSFDYDAGGGPSSDSVMADQLVGQWYADVCGLGDLVPPGHVRSALERVFELNVGDFGDGRLGAVNGMRPDGTVDRSSEQSQEVWTGTSYALAAFMIGRGLVDEGWTTAEGVARTVWERGLWFRTPEAYDRNGDFRASIYLRPLAIWAIEEALGRVAPGD